MDKDILLGLPEKYCTRIRVFTKHGHNCSKLILFARKRGEKVQASITLEPNMLAALEDNVFTLQLDTGYV